MSTVGDAAFALSAALRTVDGIRAYPDPDNPGAAVNPDLAAAIVAPPSLQWEAMCIGPTTATFTVYLVVPLDDRSEENLYDLIGPVSEALDSVRDASVIRADPGVFSGGTQELPALELQVEVSLNG